MKKLLTILLVFCTAAVARADQAFIISLDGLQETPPVITPGSGSGTAFYDSTLGTISLSISFSGLVAPATLAHIHTNVPGLPGPVVLDLAPITTFGVTSGTISGTLPFPGPHVANLLADKAYVNIHTGFAPGGEIRGQLIAVPEPTTVVFVGLGITTLVFGLRRRRA